MDLRVIIAAITLSITGCGGGGSSDSPQIINPYVYEVPITLNDGWQVGTVEDVGIEPESMTDLTNAILDKQYTGIDSFIIVKDGLLVHEVYFNNYDMNKVHDLRSATKSITSALVGVAIDNNFIGSVDELVFPRDIGYSSYRNWDDQKNDIEIEHLLTMTSGLACDDWVSSSPSNERKMYKKRDWVKFILDLQLINTPGDFWSYCTGGVVTLGAIIEQSSGMPAEIFAENYFFTPLEITNYHWEFTPQRRVDSGGHIHMIPRDMAKIGKLFLQKGSWRGQQLVSERWVEDSTSSKVTTRNNSDYGYLWWRDQIDGIDYYYASGNGGQYICIVPSLDIVVVSTGSNYNSSLSRQFFTILKNYVFNRSS